MIRYVTVMSHVLKDKLGDCAAQLTQEGSKWSRLSCYNSVVAIKPQNVVYSIVIRAKQAGSLRRTHCRNSQFWAKTGRAVHAG